MSKYEKSLAKILAGTSDRNIDFSELRGLLKKLAFEERVKGSHHIFTRDDVVEILNLQPRGKSAKPYQAYQVKQVREIIVRYRLADDVVDDEESNAEAQTNGG